MTLEADAVLDLFAGPGGWEQGARQIGLRVDLGIEFDPHACATAIAAGFARLQADIATLIPRIVAPYGIRGLIASPPCQAWSKAGDQLGELDREHCHELADRMAAGDDSTEWTDWADPRSSLVCQPVRWVRDLNPEWIALEEVPGVLGLWEHFGRIFTSWGYHVWTGVLMAADYGVPQKRRRAFLIASRVQRVHPPMPTHAENPDMFTEPWVTMADALGWGMTGKPYPTIACSSKTGGPDMEKVGGSGARASLYAERDSGRWKVAQRESSDEALNPDSWTRTRPATTIAGRDLVADPGANANRFNTSTKGRNDGIRVSIDEAAVLQSFPAMFPWKGGKSEQFRQVGNAVPPLLAAHVLRAAGAVVDALVGDPS